VDDRGISIDQDEYYDLIIIDTDFEYRIFFSRNSWL